MGDAQNIGVASLGESVERRRFHLDGQDAPPLCDLYCFRGLAEWGVRRPSWTDDGTHASGFEGVVGQSHQRSRSLAIFGRARIVVTGSLVAQSAIDDDKVWRRSGRSDLARRCYTQQEVTTAFKQFFCDQNCKWRADCAADDADSLAGQFKSIQLGVVARPSFEGL